MEPIAPGGVCGWLSGMRVRLYRAASPPRPVSINNPARSLPTLCQRLQHVELQHQKRPPSPAGEAAEVELSRRSLAPAILPRGRAVSSHLPSGHDRLREPRASRSCAPPGGPAPGGRTFGAGAGHRIRAGVHAHVRSGASSPPGLSAGPAFSGVARAPEGCFSEHRKKSARLRFPLRMPSCRGERRPPGRLNSRAPGLGGVTFRLGSRRSSTPCAGEGSRRQVKSVRGQQGSDDEADAGPEGGSVAPARPGKVWRAGPPAPQLLPPWPSAAPSSAGRLPCPPRHGRVCVGTGGRGGMARGRGRAARAAAVPSRLARRLTRAPPPPPGGAA